VILPIVVRILTGLVKGVTTTEHAEVALATKLQERQHGPNYVAFVEKAALAFLKSEHPICVFVDDTAQLDELTFDILLQAMKPDPEWIASSVLWVVVERKGASRIGDALAILAGGNYVEFAMTNLTEKEKRDFLERNNLPPENARHTLMKNLVREWSAEEKARHRTRWEELLQLEGVDEGLRPSELLRIVALNQGCRIPMADNELVSMMTKKKDSLFCQMILSPFLGLPFLTRDTVTRLISTIRTEFGDLLETTGDIGGPVKVKVIVHRDPPDMRRI
jgi:hypothetical protein